MREVLNHFAEKCGPHGFHLWSKNFSLTPQIEKLLCALPNISGQDVEILKTSERRCVFRVNNVPVEKQSCIVKGFPLPKIESKLKYKKYGLSEFANYYQAAMRQIPTPKCHGYFELRRFGFVRANGVVIEDLNNHQSLSQLAEIEPEKRLEIFFRAIPTLKLLFEKGVNHIDVTPQNLMQSHDASEMRLIDWQYCAFVAPHQTAQLVFQATHFLKYAKMPATSQNGRSWLEKLLEETNCPMDKNQFVKSVVALQNGPKLSSETRLQLKIDPQTFAA